MVCGKVTTASDYSKLQARSYNREPHVSGIIDKGNNFSLLRMVE